MSYQLFFLKQYHGSSGRYHESPSIDRDASLLEIKSNLLLNFILQDEAKKKKKKKKLGNMNLCK